MSRLKVMGRGVAARCGGVSCFAMVRLATVRASGTKQASTNSLRTNFSGPTVIRDRDVTSHGGRCAGAQTLPRGRRFDGIGKLVCCRPFACVAKILVEIVDAPVINQLPLSIEYSRLRGDLRRALLHQNMLRVAN